MTPTTLSIRPMTVEDWPEVERIFAEGIAAGNATFESTIPTWEQFDSGKVSAPRLVAVDDDLVVGWVAASPVSSRAVYRGVVEHSVYVAADAQGRGVGRALLEAFVEAAEAAGFWTIQASIFPENVESLALHERVGFRVVGRRERIARSSVGPWAGQWRDTILIERRRRSSEDAPRLPSMESASDDEGMTRSPTVLFVCVHNAGRSQMAAGYMAALSGGRVEVLSAGSEPKDQINPVAIAAMAEEGIDIADNVPKILTTEAVRDSDVVITMGCGDTCPIFPGKRYEDWELEDPAGKDLMTVRRVRDDIKGRVEALLAEILPAATS